MFDPTRRGLLRGLATLPLIGGGVTILGKPTAAAVPMTDALQARYLAWLAHEHRAAVKEHAFRSALAHGLRHPEHILAPLDYARKQAEDAGHYIGWLPEARDVEAMTKATATSTRAAIVLSAVGCALTAA